MYPTRATSIIAEPGALLESVTNCFSISNYHRGRTLTEGISGLSSS